MIELGTSGSPSANYCQVYNYYAGAANPTSCAAPSPGTGVNNGNVMGYFYQDSVNSSLGHTATYGYDTINRLTSAVATGNSTYNLTFGYNQDGSGRFGNMSCVLNGQTNGLCPQYTFNAANNQITGYHYDLAGNLLSDGTYSYTWDAEGRMISLSGSGVSETTVYNALGQTAAGSSSSANWSSVYDPSGQWIGQYNSTGGCWWGEYVRLGGRVVAFNSQCQGITVFLHKDMLTTTHMATGPSGSVLQDQVFYPWGQSWNNLGTWYQQEFAGLDGEDPSTGFYGSLSRAYNPSPGRWLSPDILGGDVSNPQSLNRYAYSLNNPTSMIDPSGLSTNSAITCDPFTNPSCDPTSCDPIVQNCTDLCDPEDPADCPSPPPPPPPGGGGGGTAPNSGLPGPSGSPGMPGVSGNAAFGGLYTCTQSQVTIGGVSYPVGPIQCTLTPLGVMASILSPLAGVLAPMASGARVAAAAQTTNPGPTVPRVPNRVGLNSPSVLNEDIGNYGLKPLELIDRSWGSLGNILERIGDLWDGPGGFQLMVNPCLVNPTEFAAVCGPGVY